MHQDHATTLGWCCRLAGDKLMGKKSHCVVSFKSKPHTHKIMEHANADDEGHLGDLLSSWLLKMGFCWFPWSSQAMKAPREADATMGPYFKAAPPSSTEIFPCLLLAAPQLRSAAINQLSSTRANFTPAKALTPGTQPPVPPLLAEFVPSVAAVGHVLVKVL